jgi:predicted acetyltransferase
MLDPQDVTLERIASDSAPLLTNLLELYVHDLSAVFGVEVGADGRFGYDKLPLYWSHPTTHFAYLIRVRGRVAGFALVTRGSPATADPLDLDLAEFFVLRSYRRSGVGRRAAVLLWNSLPAHWIVRVAEAHRDGLCFWEETIRHFTHGAFGTTAYRGKHHVFRVFSFGSPASTAAV